MTDCNQTVYTLANVTGVLGLPSIPHTLLLTAKVHTVVSESLGVGRLVQVVYVVLVESGQSPQSAVILYSIEEQEVDAEVQLNVTCVWLILVKLILVGGGYGFAADQ